MATMTDASSTRAATRPVAGRGVVDGLAALRRRDRWRGVGVTAGLLALLGLLALAGLSWGRTPLSPAEVAAALTNADDANAFVVQVLRLPRLALAAAVGAALGLSGALLQSVVRNPLASPDIVGLTGGASAAAVLAIASGAVGVAVDAAALAGGLGAAATVFLLSGRGVAGTRFVVIGVGMAFFAQGVLGYGLTRASLTEARSAFFWLVGSVGTAPWADVTRVSVVLGGVVVGLLLARRPLSALALDDDTARAIGARPVAARVGAILASTLLAAVAVAVAGPIAFVAFLSGPVARGLRGRGPALVVAALVGATVVVAADLVATHALPGALQPPVGLVTGAIGAPVLVWILVRGERRKESPA